VKKITAIFFLSLYLFSATELRQLVKFPFLIQHFIEHKNENKKITLQEFLHIHYAEKTVIDDDYTRDMQLPFKSHEDCYTISFNAITVNFFPASIEKPITLSPEKHLITNDEFINVVFRSSVWQPPRPSFS
jgi:hypothetical protein